MSLRDRLRGRALPSERITFPQDHAAYEAAERELQEAAAALLEAQQRGWPTTELEARREEAQAAADAVAYVAFDVVALAPEDWEALVAAHPAPAGAPEDQDYESATFHPALLAASVTVDGEAASVEDWDAMRKAGEISPGEMNMLIHTALALNLRVPSVRVGKG